jgi:AcrR family transcriptional regulator
MGPTMTRRQQQKDETRRLILDTAYALFEEQGYEKTTTRQLAIRAGVASGTVFQHFPDKASLLVAAFEDDLDAVIDRAFDTLPAAELRAQLVHLVREIFGFYARSPALSRSLLKEILFLEGDPGDTLAGLMATFLGRVGDLFQQAVDLGEMPVDTDVAQTLMAFFSFYMTCLIGGVRGEVFQVDIWVEMFGRLLDDFILTGTPERTQR